jgi:hypothetical protein
MMSNRTSWKLWLVTLRGSRRRVKRFLGKRGCLVHFRSMFVPFSVMSLNVCALADRAAARDFRPLVRPQSRRSTSIVDIIQIIIMTGVRASRALARIRRPIAHATVGRTRGHPEPIPLSPRTDSHARTRYLRTKKWIARLSGAWPPVNPECSTPERFVGLRERTNRIGRVLRQGCVLAL